MMQNSFIQHLLSIQASQKDNSPRDSEPRPVPTARAFDKATTTPLVQRICEEFENNIRQDEVVSGWSCGSCRNCKRDPKCQKKCILAFGSNVDKVNAISVSFPEEPVHCSKNGDFYYRCVKVREEQYTAGDCVAITSPLSGAPNYIARVKYFFRNKEVTAAHVQFYAFGNQTALGNSADEKELFLLEECEDVEMTEIIAKVKVVSKPLAVNWTAEEERGNGVFWTRLKYDSRLARFEEYVQINSTMSIACDACHLTSSAELNKIPKIVEKIITLNGEDMWIICLKYCGRSYSIGDSIYLCPGAYAMPYERKRKKEIPKIEYKVDEMVFTEYYRHSQTSSIKGSNNKTQIPFRIGVIEDIWKEGSKVKLKVRKMFRQENTHLSLENNSGDDIHKLYWSNDFISVEAPNICGKCFLLPESLVKENLTNWTQSRRHRFYFGNLYNSKKRTFESISAEIMKKYQSITQDQSTPNNVHPLRSLDIFSGCGGLSNGLEQSGAINSKWAIEQSYPAAIAFQKNNPGCKVYNKDCNHVLKNLISGDGVRLGYPTKEEVEVICGGPPCQGFSHMNIFSESDYSQFKNQGVVTFLGFCDYYRPKYILMENVRNFALYKGGSFLKLCLRALITMGYQCTFGILQAGNFGVPQTRRRCFIMAAVSGTPLPMMPNPLHVFAHQNGNLKVNLDFRCFAPQTNLENSAPHQTVTVGEAINDLPVIGNGTGMIRSRYSSNPKNSYQRIMRHNSESGQIQKVLLDHKCRRLEPIKEVRISYIPKVPGSDWRDLPNIEIPNGSGQMTKKLKYTHDIASSGRKGVCQCQVKPGTDCSSAQENTLIPWFLPHRAETNNQFSGCYGRIHEEGFFSTTVTQPDPERKQGRVLHPYQHRIVSIRECARSQGFKDNFEFHGKMSDKYRQIGNAVPPPLAKALGFEIKKSLQRKEH